VAIDRKQEFTLLRHTRALFLEGTLSGLTDLELLERFVEQRGERSELAFTVLLERHARMVLAACRRVLGDRHDVQDAFQATFLVLVRNARSIRNRESVAGWLQSVAYRVACSARSAAKRRRFHERGYAEQRERGLTCEIQPDADLKPVLDQELSLLPECQRVVLVLCDLEGLTYDQAAQALGWPMGTVKSRLARGRDRLRSRLIRRGVAPSLAIIGEIWSRDAASAPVPSVLLQSTVNAAMSAGLSRFAAIAISPGVLTLVEGAMKSILLTKAKLSLAAIAIGSCLVATTACFVGPGLRAAAQETRDAKSLPGGKAKPVTAFVANSSATKSEHASQAKQSAREPNRSNHTNPAPWETVVRIRVLTEGAVRFGSGTVIQSSPEESLILTCARTFQLEGEQTKPPDPFSEQIMVDLFDGKLHGERPAHVNFVESIGGEAVDYDFNLDVGLIRVRPLRSLPASRVVPKRWQPRARMKMLTAGCSEGKDATFWNTTIINPNTRGLAGNKSYEATECRNAPKQGRTGGGLFTTDGYLAGVCNFAEPRADAGLYAAPQSIYLLLDRNGLSSVYEDQSTESARADFGQLVREDEHPDQPSAQPSELDKFKDTLARSTLLNEKLTLEVRELRDQLSRLRAAARKDSAAQPATNDKASNDLNLAKGSPAALPQSASVPAGRGSDPTSQAPRTETPSSSATSPRSTARRQRKPSLRHGGLIFATSPTGNKVIAHNAFTQKDQSVLLNATRENPLDVSFIGFEEVVGLDLKGTRITRTAAYDYRAGAWIPLDLREPVSGELKFELADTDTVSCDAGRHYYTYSTRTGKWDHFDLGSITDTQEAQGLTKPAR